MTTPRRWFDRKFELGLGADAALELLERLRRTPERLSAAVQRPLIDGKPVYDEPPC